MFRILVASAKGGVGKTTISTTLAGHFALKGKRTVLLDADPQASARIWCGKREAAGAAPVLALDGTRRQWRQQIPDKAQRVVIDAPAGAMPDELEKHLAFADVLLVPVLPSVLDMEATVRFLNPLAEVPRVARGELPVGLIANRLKPWTHASQQVTEQLSQWPVELVAQLRDTQAYVLLAGLGKCIYDYNSGNVRDHQGDWEPLLRWLKQVRRNGR